MTQPNDYVRFDVDTKPNGLNTYYVCLPLEQWDSMTREERIRYIETEVGDQVYYGRVLSIMLVGADSGVWKRRTFNWYELTVQELDRAGALIPQWQAESYCCYEDWLEGQPKLEEEGEEEAVL